MHEGHTPRPLQEKLSFGDPYFSQGDGEITFCGAIEVGGFMDLHVDLVKGGMAMYGIKENVMFMPGRRDSQYSGWLAFSGVSDFDVRPTKSGRPHQVKQGLRGRAIPGGDYPGARRTPIRRSNPMNLGSPRIGSSAAWTAANSAIGARSSMADPSHAMAASVSPITAYARAISHAET